MHYKASVALSLVHHAHLRSTVVAAAPTAGAFILEADGALTDLHMDGHRVAFNR
jgi:hypothetical protein